jgi:RNA polymerase sigma-70 factor, ECF subfamily
LVADLAATFRKEMSAAGAAGVDDAGPDLAARLAALCERGRAGFPELAVDDQAFVTHLARAAGRGGFGAAGLGDLAIEDLYLACACLLEVPGAIEAFDRRCAAPIRAAISSIARTPAEQDEIQQQLRDVLLVGTGGTPPKIATYAGRGALGRWVGVSAQRLALMMVRADQSEARAREAAANEAVAEATHPELALLKERYRADFSEAMAGALASLPRRERMVMRLNLVGGMTVEAIGKMYGVSQSTASRWLASARASVLAEAQRRLRESLHVPADEFQSIAALVASQLDLSVSRLLRSR